MSRSLLFVLAMSIAGTASAQTFTAPITVKQVRTGWNADMFAIVPVQSMINPASCSSPDGYVSTSTEPGYQTHLAASLMAFSLDASVVVAVDNTKCLAGRPVIIGVSVTH